MDLKNTEKIAKIIKYCHDDITELKHKTKTDYYLEGICDACQDIAILLKTYFATEISGFDMKEFLEECGFR